MPFQYQSYFELGLSITMTRTCERDDLSDNVLVTFRRHFMLVSRVLSFQVQKDQLADGTSFSCTMAKVFLLFFNQ
jgi:hypothetical protein